MYKKISTQIVYKSEILIPKDYVRFNLQKIWTSFCKLSIANNTIYVLMYKADPIRDIWDKLPDYYGAT